MMRRLVSIIAIFLIMVSSISSRAANHGAQQTLDITKYTQTFSSNFSAGLTVTANGPSTSGQWIYNKPGGGNFGGVGWGDVFSTSSAGLQISLFQTAGQWHAGLLASVDQSGNGFSQQWGYFEMKAKFPAALGSNWPAFWLESQTHVVTPSVADVEIDVVEQFGNFNPTVDNYTYHHWISPTPVQNQYSTNIGTMSDGFYTYGVDIEPDFITWYFNRIKLGSMATPNEAAVPFYIIVDLALSGDTSNPSPATTNPSNMLVNYINVYSKNP